MTGQKQELSAYADKMGRSEVHHHGVASYQQHLLLVHASTSEALSASPCLVASVTAIVELRQVIGTCPVPNTVNFLLCHAGAVSV